MAIYLEKCNGYIADNPNIDFERCDGERFSYYEVNTASMSNTSNSLTVQGGQGNYPLAFIETDKTQEFTFASSQFSLEMFSMANAVKMVTEDVGTLESGLYAVGGANKITLPFEVQEGSVKIRGLKEGQKELSSGQFAVTITPANSAQGKTEIEFFGGDLTEGQEIRISYRRRVIGAESASVLSTSTTARGSLYAHWPVYSSGTDCSESAKKGILHAYLPRVRATALPGFDNSLELQAA